MSKPPTSMVKIVSKLSSFKGLFNTPVSLLSG
jgi:hypothetical protein